MTNGSGKDHPPEPKAPPQAETRGESKDVKVERQRVGPTGIPLY
jgi:hypothetical protein